MRIAVFVLLLWITALAKGQIHPDSIQSIIDSGWSAVRGGKNIPGGWEVTDRLIEIYETQGNPKALINAYQIRGEAMYWTAALDSALYWYGKALDESRKWEDRNEEGHTLVSIATIKSEAGKWRVADSLYSEGLRIRREMADTNNMLFILNYKSWNLNKAEMHHLAMRESMQTLKYAEATRDTYYMSVSYMGMGIAHKKQNNLEKAYESLDKAAQYSRKIGDDYGYAVAHTDLSMVLKSMGNYEEAHRRLSEVSLPFFTEAEYAFGLVQIYGNMAVCSNLMGNHKRALAETDSALARIGGIDRKESESDIYHERAKALFGLGRTDEAMEWVRRAIALAEGVSLEKLRDAYETKSKILSTEGKFKESLLAYQTYAEINDSILNEEKSRQVLELQTVYETAEKEKAIERLEAESVLAETKRKALIGGIAALLLLSTVIINREVNRRKKAKKLHEAEIKLAEAENARLEDQLAFKRRELTTLALEIARKNEMVEDIKADLLKADKQSEVPEVGEVFRKIDFNSKVDKNWERFIDAFKETNGDFLREITSNYPDLSKSELRLCALIKMNLSSKDIASILNISDEGVKKARYRLRKKLQLDTNDNLESTILSMA